MGKITLFLIICSLVLYVGCQKEIIQEKNLAVEDEFTIKTDTLECPNSCDDNDQCTEDYCSLETNFTCKHDEKIPCCGNGVCEKLENYITCLDDCKSVLYGIKDRKLKDFAKRSFFNDGLVIDEEWAQIMPRGYLDISFTVPDGLDSLVSIEVYKGEENYDYYRDNNDYFVGASKQYKGSTEKEVRWNDIIVYLWTSAEGNPITDQVANAYIDIPSQNTVISIIFWVGFDRTQINPFFDEYFSWLADPETKTDVDVIVVQPIIG